ncbi:ribosomal large subunit pseudouridine synthase B [Acidothermus cellulolyticus 11B]|uniref:Pseudouridine synthase n=1 Tax=Acidothermus cellulolyticus (strain ATCC 43068 / DSM 8971 / 11B) TaxID=351607 RepID=A0LU98_ACIC1|nr:pseudouridine synthase [Acidothermus cellulolyticus]ABK53008.1 ribosomal large subunit pseudouridine synthase B [Acidothermus cellulolyticus 11B]
MSNTRSSPGPRGLAPHSRAAALSLPAGDDGAVRLQKVLAAAGVGSRRACEELIAAGRVEVDGVPVTRLGVRVDPQTAVIRVDGKRIPPATPFAYFALNKPRGVVTTMSDPRGRPCVGDLVADLPVRVFHVGRLDTDSEGLLLLTNDGRLTHRLTHPSHAVPKTYVADVEGRLGRTGVHLLRSGVDLADGPAQADAVRILERYGARTLVEVVVHEGRTHLVRRMLAAVGHPVRRLVRTAIGPVALGQLRPGARRQLTPRELGELLDLVGL